jgi:transposase
VITLEDWALIRRLAGEGVPKAQIAVRLGISRTTVVKAVASQAPPKYERRPAPTSFTPFEPLVRRLLVEHPDMPATVIAERVGWTGSITWFRDNVRRLRPERWPVDPADRLRWLPGDAARVLVLPSALLAGTGWGRFLKCPGLCKARDCTEPGAPHVRRPDQHRARM